MKKQIALLLTVFVLAFTLTACGAQSEETDGISSATPKAENVRPLQTASNEAAKTLVAFFSRSGENYGVGVIEKGNTEIIAEMIAEATGADMFRIQTVKVYPESYEECKKVATQERNVSARPELASTVANFEDYDVIYLGYPIWYGDMPMAVYTFLESYDFTGKTIIPFCTHGGSGLAGTVRSLQAACSGAAVLDGLAIAGTTAQNDRDTAKRLVETWLGK